jgi:ligand-binding sensor domain-containing protein
MNTSGLRVAFVLIMLLNPILLLAQKSTPLPDTPYVQDYHEAYPLKTPAENDVRALAFDAAGRLWAATGHGVRYLENKVWKTPQGGDRLNPAHALYRDAQGTHWVGAWNGLYRATTDKVVLAGVTDAPVSAIRGMRTGNGTAEILFVVTPKAILRGENGQWTPIKRTWQTVVRAILPTPDNGLWIATASGLYHQKESGGKSTTTRYGRPDVLLSSNLYALTPLPDGTFAIGSTGGIDFYKGTKRVRSLAVKDGLPNRHARAIARDADGRLWIATRLGVARYTPFYTGEGAASSAPTEGGASPAPTLRSGSSKARADGRPSHTLTGALNKGDAHRTSPRPPYSAAWIGRPCRAGDARRSVA